MKWHIKLPLGQVIQNDLLKDSIDSVKQDPVVGFCVDSNGPFGSGKSANS
jgi:hypothetical protein